MRKHIEPTTVEVVVEMDVEVVAELKRRFGEDWRAGAAFILKQASPELIAEVEPEGSHSGTDGEVGQQFELTVVLETLPRGSS